MRMQYTLCAAGALFIAATASAAPTFLITYGDTLYTRQGATQGTSLLSDDITALAVHPDGRVFGTSRSEADGDPTKFELYTLDTPLTTPTLSLVGDFLDDNTPTITFIGTTMYGIQKTPGGTNNNLITIDYAGLSQSVVGATGLISGAGGVPDSLSASAYDPGADTIWALDKGVDGELFSVDRTTADPTGNFVANTGQRTGNEGAEFWNGTLWQVVYDNTAAGNLILGKVNTATGLFTPVVTIDSGLATGGEIGLAIIPTPGTLALIGLGGLAGSRRRRR